MEAPSRSIARIFVSGAVSITITDARAPTSRAASATPCAALPALTVQTPSRKLVGRQLPDDVVGTADLERSDRLQQLELEVELGDRAAGAPQIEANQRRANGRAVDGIRRVTDRGQRNASTRHRDRQGQRS